VGEDDHVSGGELDLLLAEEAAVAAALGEDVVGDNVFRRREDPGREFARRQGLDAPRISGLDSEEERPVEANNAQQVGKGVHSKA